MNNVIWLCEKLYEYIGKLTDRVCRMKKNDDPNTAKCHISDLYMLQQQQATTTTLLESDN